jgi:hypothetical protein
VSEDRLRCEIGLLDARAQKQSADDGAPAAKIAADHQNAVV